LNPKKVGTSGLKVKRNLTKKEREYNKSAPILPGIARQFTNDSRKKDTIIPEAEQESIPYHDASMDIALRNFTQTEENEAEQLTVDETRVLVTE